MKDVHQQGRKSGRYTKAGILASIVLVSLLHYLTKIEYQFLHAIFQKLYYICIIYTAFMYGARGSAPVAMACSLLFIPHIIFQWGGPHNHHFADQVSDIFMFNIIGIVTGVLSDKEKMLRRMYMDAYEKLQDSFDKAGKTARMAAIGQISAAVAHEIRNPLNGIKGAQDILLERFSKDDPEYRFVEIVRREMDRLNGIITDFLEFARPREPEIITTNAANVARSVTDLCRPQAAARQATVVFVEENTGLTARMDADQIRQALLNLTLNAIESCGAGGAVTLSVAEERGHVVFRVRDTGIGIGAEAAEKLFEPFFTTKNSGTGLGLSVSSRIVEKHGGEIDYASEPGKGTVFEIRLPL